MDQRRRNQPAISIHCMLNSVGIALLERRCFGQSLDTFKQALQHLKHEYNKKQVENPPESNFEDLLRQATSRLNALEPFPYPIKMTCSHTLLEDIFFAEDVELILDQLSMRMCPSSGIFMLISLDSRTNGGPRTGPYISLDLASAIVTYNYAICYMAYANALLQRQKVMAHELHRQTSVNLLRLSASIMEKMIEEEDKQFDTFDSDLYRLLLYVDLIMLVSLHDQVIGTNYENLVERQVQEINLKITTETQLLAEMKKSCITALAA